MAGILLAMGLQTWPVLSLSLKFEQRARAIAWPYAHGSPRHSSKYRNFRLFLNYSLFIQFLYMFALHYNIGMKNCRPIWWRKRQHTRWHQPKRGGYGSRDCEAADRGSAADGPDVPLHSWSFYSDRSSPTSDDISSGSVSGSCNSSYEPLHNLVVSFQLLEIQRTQRLRDLQNVKTQNHLETQRVQRLRLT